MNANAGNAGGTTGSSVDEGPLTKEILSDHDALQEQKFRLIERAELRCPGRILFLTRCLDEGFAGPGN